MANKKIKSINLHGKEYAMVHDRVNAFRSEPNYNDLGIQTMLIHYDNERGFCVIKAEVQDKTGFVVASGIADERRTPKGVNSTSFVENCETSAIGRALACLGIGTEDAYASSFEVENAIDQQKTQENQNASLQEKMEAKLEVNIGDIIDEINASIFVDIAEEHLPNVPSFLSILADPNRTVAQMNELHAFGRMYPDNENKVYNFAIANKEKWQLSKSDEDTVRTHLGFIKTLFDTIPFENESAQFEQEMSA